MTSPFSFLSGESDLDLSVGLPPDELSLHPVPVGHIHGGVTSDLAPDEHSLQLLAVRAEPRPVPVRLPILKLPFVVFSVR